MSMILLDRSEFVFALKHVSSLLENTFNYSFNFDLLNLFKNYFIKNPALKHFSLVIKNEIKYWIIDQNIEQELTTKR